MSARDDRDVHRGVAGDYPALASRSAVRGRRGRALDERARIAVPCVLKAASIPGYSHNAPLRTALVYDFDGTLERAALLPILEEVIGHLPDPLMREAVLLKLHEDLSQEETGRRLGVSDTTIQRRLKRAYAILGPLLEERGLDDGWLAA